MLEVTMKVGDTVARLQIVNHSTGRETRPLYPYRYFCAYGCNRTVRGEVLHDYNDGMFELVQDVIADALARIPRLRTSGKPRNRVKCPQCGDILESVFRHDYRVCSCGATMTDGGQEPVVGRRGGVPAPEDGRLERQLRRLGRNGEVTVHFDPAKGFTLICRAGKNTMGTQLAKEQCLTGPSLSALVEEAVKRDKRGK